MRVHLELDQDASTIRFDLTGAPTAGEFQSLASIIANRRDVQPGTHVLVDARELTTFPSDEEVGDLARCYRALWLSGAVGCTALVVQRDGYRAARAFQIHSGDGDPRLAIFLNPDAAAAWLARAGTVAAPRPQRASA